MHAGGRRKGKGRSRILYWFRTPPGVRVGRAALDEDAIRLIEQHNPDVEFDWIRILKGQGIETKPAAARERESRFDRRRRPEPRPVPRSVEPSREPEHFATPAGDTPVLDEPSREIDAEAIDAIDVADVVPLAALDERLVPDERPGDVLHAVTPAHARIGSEGVSRLRARHAEVLARISERTQDPARQEELKAQAERLNPDTWVTDAEVTAGLEKYETVFEGLRGAIGGQARRRRRNRRRGSGQQAQPSPSGGGPGGSTGDHSGEASGGDDQPSSSLDEGGPADDEHSEEL